METLQEQKATLEKHLRGKESAHAQRFGGGGLNESAYQDSCREIDIIYEELAVVCQELGDPIPVKF